MTAFPRTSLKHPGLGAKLSTGLTGFVRKSQRRRSPRALDRSVTDRAIARALRTPPSSWQPATTARRRPTRPSITALLDRASRASVLKAALEGIEKIEFFLVRLEQILKAERADKAAGPAARLNAHYRATCDAIDLSAIAAGFAGVNLIDGSGRDLAIERSNRTESFDFVIPHIDLTTAPSGLDLPDPAGARERRQVEHAVGRARQRLAYARDVFTRSLAVIQE